MSDTQPGDTGVRDNGYDAFFRREYPVMVALGFALTGDREVARDVAQESMLRAYNHWSQIVTHDRPGAWCRQVTINLLKNSAEACAGREGSIIIRSGFELVSERRIGDLNVVSDGAKEGGYVFIEVQDNGPGISPEAARKIFDPFFTTKQAGRGLGLASVQGIMRRHQGLIGIESTPGRGTSFKVFFPCESPSAE